MLLTELNINTKYNIKYKNYGYHEYFTLITQQEIIFNYIAHLNNYNSRLL